MKLFKVCCVTAIICQLTLSTTKVYARETISSSDSSSDKIALSNEDKEAVNDYTRNSTTSLGQLPVSSVDSSDLSDNKSDDSRRIPVEHQETSSENNTKNDKEKESVDENLPTRSNVIITATWGTCPVEFDTESGTLTVKSGTLGVRARNVPNPPNTFPYEIVDSSTVKHIVFDGSVRCPPNSGSLFEFDQLVDMTGMENLDTSAVTDMNYMFFSSDKLQSLDLSFFDTSSVVNMESMFAACASLTSLDLGAFNTSSVTNMDSMFDASYRLESINLSSFNTSLVSNMSRMFAICNNLTSLNLSSFNTEAVKDMESMFYSTNSLKKLVLGESCKFIGDPDLYEPEYTGKWQTIGTGTDSQPNGEWIGTNEELIKRSAMKISDTYVWQPAGANQTAGNLIIKYQDAEGNKLAPSKVITGNVGEEYDASTGEYKISIEGYSLKRVDGSVTGVLSNQEQSVVFIYEKLVGNETNNQGSDTTESSVIDNKNKGDNDFDKTTDSKEHDDTNHSTSKEISNKSSKKSKNQLPKTGEINSMGFTILGSIILAGIMLSYLIKIDKHKRKDGK